MTSDAPPPLEAADVLEERSLDVLITHNEHRWAVEEENSRRVSNRTGQLLTLIAALLGLGLFQVSQSGQALHQLKPRGLAILVSIFLALSVIFLMWALKNLLGVRMQESVDAGSEHNEDTPADSGLASSSLAWPSEFTPESEAWPAVDPRDAKKTRFWGLDEASTALHKKNLRAFEDIAKSTEKLFAAAICAAMAFLCYLFLK